MAASIRAVTIAQAVGDGDASAFYSVWSAENVFFNGFAEKWEDNIKGIDELGGPKHFNHFPSSWAHAMNAPF
jgi:arylsulfatase